MTDHLARATLAAATLRQVVEEIDALHVPVQAGPPSLRYWACGECCQVRFVNGAVDCTNAEHRHETGDPICPTAAILNRLGL